MAEPKKSDATTECPSCGEVMKITMVEPVQDDSTVMQHRFLCQSCSAEASYQFKKKGAA